MAGGVQGVSKETLKHQEAFDYYYSLGDSRTLQQVATKFNKSLKTVSNWSSSFGWQRRIVERDRKIALKLQRELDKQIVEDKKQYHSIIKASIGVYLQNLKDGKVKIDSAKDLVALINCDIPLMEMLDKGTAEDFNNVISVSSETADTISKLRAEIDGAVGLGSLLEDGDTDGT